LAFFFLRIPSDDYEYRKRGATGIRTIIILRVISPRRWIGTSTICHAFFESVSTNFSLNNTGEREQRDGGHTQQPSIFSLDSIISESRQTVGTMTSGQNDRIPISTEHPDRLANQPPLTITSHDGRSQDHHFGSPNILETITHFTSR
jgi:hypothetical protein